MIYVLPWLAVIIDYQTTELDSSSYTKGGYIYGYMVKVTKSSWTGLFKILCKKPLNINILKFFARNY